MNTQSVARLSAPFRQALSARGLGWAVGIPRHQKVYPADVQLISVRTSAKVVLSPATSSSP
ncbi:hypothetical protein [Sphingobium sp. LSP13-1-1.1]|uniref:hypothetical protein n=1 Tax=Sphingobium sp. LSP13-1-1.1 TaxID=3135234 RepID=UPI00342BBAFC